MDRKTKSAADRFWEKVQPTGFCWEWTAFKNEYGYGVFTPEMGASPIGAHRYAYGLLVGMIPDGMHLDHLCRNRCCVNPDHLEPVTPGENVRRGFGLAATYATRTACDAGHEFTPENTAVRPDGSRRCLTCLKEWQREKVPCSKCGKAISHPNKSAHEKRCNA